MRKIFTFLLALVASVGMSWATTNSITINESSYGSVVASSSSAAAGETITLTATPDDGYQLKSISGVYEAQATSSETLNFVAAKTTVTGTNFQCVGTTTANNYGWRVNNTTNTLTVSSLNGTTLIEKIEFTSTWGAQRKNDMLSVSEGTLSFDGNDPSTTVTINDINATSVTISGSGTNNAKTWCIASVKVYYTATIEKELEISDTENANVKTFTMVDGEVTISAEFEPAPVVLADCELSWKDVPEGGVVGTIGHEDEINLPYFTASLDFMLALDAGTVTLRLGSTDESVLVVYGLNNFAVNGVGECDVYIVHDEDAVFAYDSAAFHVTVNPEPTPVVNLKLIEFQVPASWENDNTPISSADFPDFVATTYEIASALPVTSEPALVVFDFPGDDEVSVYTKVGGQVSKASTGTIVREAFFGQPELHYYYPVLAGEPDPTAVENVQTNQVQATKFFRNGQLLIEKNGKLFNLTGAEVK